MNSDMSKGKEELQKKSGNGSEWRSRSCTDSHFHSDSRRHCGANISNFGPAAGRICQYSEIINSESRSVIWIGLEARGFGKAIVRGIKGRCSSEIHGQRPLQRSRKNSVGPGYKLLRCEKHQFVVYAIV